MNKLMNKTKTASKYWWTSLLVGILAIILGIWFLYTPANALVTFIYVFIITFLISGFIDAFFAICNRKIYSGWGWALTGGIIDILFALILISLPISIITAILVYFIGFWIMFRSIWTIGTAFQLNGTENAGWFVVIGIIGLIFSFFYIISPVFGSVTLIVLACVSFIAYGIFRISYAFKLKSINKEIK